MKIRPLLIACCLLTTPLATAAEPFTPLLPSGADPWAVYHNGWFYYTHTTGRNLALWKTRSLSGLATAEKKIVWTPPAAGPYSRNIWAPELHRIRGRWYFYFAADDGRNRNHRLWVLENRSADPFEGAWEMKGQLRTPGDKWAIDASVFEHRGRLYLLWSGWEGDENGRQDIYIARLENPWTTAGPRVRISTPEYDWERIGDIPRPGPDDKPHVDVNEGPEALIRNGRVFVVYSASGCWTDHYALGMLWAGAGDDLLNPAAWHKMREPVFRAGLDTPGTVSAGHNSFFRTPSGEDWILYHANAEPGQGCGSHRSPRAQKFGWTEDGLPDFDRPLAVSQPVLTTTQFPLPAPSCSTAQTASLP